MKIISPEKIKLRVEKISESEWQLNYVERFSEANREAATMAKKLLVNGLKAFLKGKFKIRVFEDGMSLCMKAPREVIYNAVVGEFLGESSLGKKTLGELFGVFSAIAGMISPEKVEALRQLQDLPQSGVVGEVQIENGKEVT